MINVIRTIGGTTLKPTWVNSGVTPTSLSSALLDASENLVNSIAATSSLNGFFYALHAVPNTRAWFVNEWIAVVGVNTYVSRQFINAQKLEVD